MVFVDEAGACSFRIYLPEASRVDIVGDFTQWQRRAIRMRRDQAGWWTASTTLPEGEFQFQYLIDGRVWLADFAAGGIRRNDYGAWVSLFSVDGLNAPVEAAGLKAA